MTVQGDADALRRALDNLLENAEVHGPRGGEVAVSLTLDDGRAALAVRDEGPGFAAGRPRARLRALLARARRARPRRARASGLAIVRATAERHGGTRDRRRLDGDDRTPGERRLTRVSVPGTSGSRAVARTVRGRRAAEDIERRSAVHLNTSVTRPARGTISRIMPSRARRAQPVETFQ